MFEPLLMQQNRAIGAPTQAHLIAPIDGPLRSAAIILRENSHDLSGFRLDPISRAIAEVSQFPNHTLDLIEAVAGDRFLAQVNFFRTQCHPHALSSAEAPQL